MFHKSRRPSILGAVCLMLLATGCARGPRIEPLLAEKFQPRPPDYPIQLTEGSYKDPCLEIAVVTTQPYDDRMVETLGKVELQRLARELGGDAVIRVCQTGVFQEELERRPDTIPRLAGHMEDRVALTGIVVRFKRSAP